LKNFCFNEGVKVTRQEISTDEEFDLNVLEKNFFSKPKSYFCLVQQVSPEDIQKYFILGIKFEDFYITPCLKDNHNFSSLEPNSIKKLNKIDLHRKNYVNIFTYEKTYLFISYDPLCKLFENIFNSILGVKKLNFLHNMSDFSCIFIKENFNQFNKENTEKQGKQINEILNFFFESYSPCNEEVIKFKSELNNISCEYKHPNQFNETFLAIEWLSKKFFPLTDSHTLFKILIRILAENSIVFISKNIQNLTSTVLGFSYLIQPFKWPFILIPNLPHELMNMIDSPVPFLIGILGDEQIKKKMIRDSNSSTNYDIVFIDDSNRIELNELQALSFEEPYLKNLKFLLKNLFEEDGISMNKKNKDDDGRIYERVYKRIYDNLKSEIASKIDQIARVKLFSISEEGENSKKLQPDQEKKLENNNEFMKDSKSCNNNCEFDLKPSLDAHNETLNKVLSPSEYNVIKSTFDNSLSEKDKSFGKVFSQTQLFMNYFEEVRLLTNKK
jgi:hypothetical protein